jgi:hypothetical protein
MLMQSEIPDRNRPVVMRTSNFVGVDLTELDDIPANIHEFYEVINYAPNAAIKAPVAV